MLCNVVSCAAMSCHVMWCDVMWCNVMSCHVMSFHACHVIWCDVFWCLLMSCDVMWCRVVSCHGRSCHVMWCHVVSCRVMAWHGVAWCGMSRHVDCNALPCNRMHVCHAWNGMNICICCIQNLTHTIKYNKQLPLFLSLRILYMWNTIWNFSDWGKDMSRSFKTWTVFNFVLNISKFSIYVQVLWVRYTYDYLCI